MNNKFDILEKAYTQHKQEGKDISETGKTALNTLAAFHNEIEKWDTSKDLLFINNYLGGKPVDCISSGRGHMERDNRFVNFKEFMQDETTREIIKLLFLLRKSKNPEEISVKDIQDIGLMNHLDKYKFAKGGTPKSYVGRFMLMIFPEQFTSIASYADLKSVAKKLEMSIAEMKNPPYENLQIQLRLLTDEFLDRIEKVEQVSAWTKLCLAWDVKKIKK